MITARRSSVTMLSPADANRNARPRSLARGTGFSAWSTPLPRPSSVPTPRPSASRQLGNRISGRPKIDRAKGGRGDSIKRCE